MKAEGSTIQAEARGDGGLHADLAEKILVRRGALKLDIAGPRVQFVGAVATYAIHVRNTGNAPARNVNFSIALPPVPAICGHRGARSSTRRKFRMALDMPMCFRPTSSGASRQVPLATVGADPVRLSAAADDDATTSAETQVQVNRSPP